MTGGLWESLHYKVGSLILQGTGFLLFQLFSDIGGYRQDLGGTGVVDGSLRGGMRNGFLKHV